MELGKKLYKTSMLNIFRLIILAIVVFFLNNFYLETFTNENFQLEARFKILDVISYHLQYPKAFITFFFTILVPAIYYAFIRGIRFHEHGFVFNRGVPFMGVGVPYSEIETYKLLHPDLAISIHTKSGEAFIVADNNIGRVIALLDQHNIRGNLASDEFVRLISNYRKFILGMVWFTVFVFLIRKFF
jgi:hypothetical protein